MERVLIVAKTRMNSGICVSGLTNKSRSVRLIPEGRFNQPPDTEFEVGQVWDIDFQEVAEIDPPHVEDVIVISKHYRRDIGNLRQTLLKIIQPWRDGPENLFNKMLAIEGRKCYIPKSGPIPNCSTGYWIPDRHLTLSQENNKFYYLVERKNNPLSRISPQVLSIRFVGLAQPVERIPSGTLIRVSLARWLLVSGEERCYLQISGWYE